MSVMRYYSTSVSIYKQKRFSWCLKPSNQPLHNFQQTEYTFN